MGNYISCTLTVSHPSTTTTKIILPNSDIRHIGHSDSGEAHTTAAELMLDFPGHFLIDSRSLRIGTRFSPLAADEDLEPASVYVMLPMHRVNSLVSAADVGPLILAAGKAAHRQKRGARVLPEAAVVAAPLESEAPRTVLTMDDDDEMMMMRNRLSLCRSRRTRLETINEESWVC